MTASHDKNTEFGFEFAIKIHFLFLKKLSGVLVHVGVTKAQRQNRLLTFETDDKKIISFYIYMYIYTEGDYLVTHTYNDKSCSNKTRN